MREVREVLDEIWNEPTKMEKVLVGAIDRNQDVFEFEKALIQ